MRGVLAIGTTSEQEGPQNGVVIVPKRRERSKHVDGIKAYHKTLNNRYTFELENRSLGGDPNFFLCPFFPFSASPLIGSR